MRLACLLLACPMLGQDFPLHFAGELGAARSLGAATVREERPGVVRLDGRDRDGRPWRVWTEVWGGIGWTTAWTSDFDRDGQRDMLVARLLQGNGSCVGRVQVVVLLFDEKGRPAPLVFESSLPLEATGVSGYPVPVATRRGREGRSEFFVRGCGGTDHWLPARVPVIAGTKGRIEELRSTGAPDGAMLLSGRWVKTWPSRVVIDGTGGREIYLHDPWLGLRRALAEGLATRSNGEELWAEGTALPRKVEVVFQVTGVSPLVAAPATPDEGTRQELDPHKNAIHTAHAAMGVTHRHSTVYDVPEAGARLISLEWHGLTQWRSATGTFFALHEDGRLREPFVLVPVFPQQDDARAVQGYLRWRALP